MTTITPDPIKYSIVVPLMNEQDNVLLLMQEIENAMSSLQQNWELICIDDGSTDQTWNHLKNVAITRPYVKLITFDKNYGQTSAFAAGFESASGQYIITMDGDCQNDPSDIPKLIKAIQNADLACGIRTIRRDTLLKKAISKLANGVRSRLCRDGVDDTGCSLKVFRASALKKIALFNGMHRFLPALFVIKGLKVVQVPVNHRQRLKGKSKYHFFNRLLKPIVDMFVVMWMRKRHLCYNVKETVGLKHD